MRSPLGCAFVVILVCLLLFFFWGGGVQKSGHFFSSLPGSFHLQLPSKGGENRIPWDFVELSFDVKLVAIFENLDSFA